MTNTEQMYKVDLKKLKTWRSGKRRFVKGRAHTMPESEANAFKADGHFTVTKVQSKAKEADKKSKGAISNKPNGEQPRLKSGVKKDAPEPPADHSAAETGQKAKNKRALKVKKS